MCFGAKMVSVPECRICPDSRCVIQNLYTEIAKLEYKIYEMGLHPYQNNTF